MRNVREAFIGLCLMAGVISTSTAGEAGHSVEEVAAIPKYCRDAQGFGPAYGGSPETAKYWYQQLGSVMDHIHHYCRGLILINRARASMSTQRTRMYNASIGEINYTLRYVDEQFPLLPEMLTRKGEALVNIQKYREGEEVLRRAVELKPDYWPAYARLAESYIQRKNLEAARETLKQGLTRVDEPRMLQRMLDDLARSQN